LQEGIGKITSKLLLVFLNIFIEGCPDVVQGKKRCNNNRKLTAFVRVQFSSQVPYYLKRVLDVFAKPFFFNPKKVNLSYG